MITTALVNLAYSFVSGIIGLFPVGTGLPAGVHSAAVFIGGYAGIFDPLIPTSTFFTVVGIIFVVEIAVFGFETLKWIVSHIPFVGGRS